MHFTRGARLAVRHGVEQSAALASRTPAVVWLLRQLMQGTNATRVSAGHGRDPETVPPTAVTAVGERDHRFVSSPVSARSAAAPCGTLAESSLFPLWLGCTSVALAFFYPSTNGRVVMSSVSDLRQHV